jgi:hypothetical protein
MAKEVSAVFDSAKSTKSLDTTDILPRPIKSEVLDGWLKLGVDGSLIKQKLGEPEKGENKYWGALGTYVQEWRYPANGIELEMESETEAGEKIVSRGGITIASPCTLKTTQRIGIGSPRVDVLRRYKDLIDTVSSDSEKIIVGTVYGGTIFTCKNSLVAQIFIGAAAE